jgi:hypothetical protein
VLAPETDSPVAGVAEFMVSVLAPCSVA